MQHELKTINYLLRDSAFTQAMAKSLDSSYYVNIGQAAPEFLTAQDDTAVVITSLKEEKIATSLAGFYALECGIGLLNAQTGKTPVELLRQITDILKSLISNTTSKEDKMIFARFANATWKAGQPFRGLNRISRPTFTPFYFLSESNIEKDMVQIKMAAQRLLPML